MFRIDFDLSQLKTLFSLGEVAKKAMADGARDLSAMGMAHALELAAQRLKSRRALFAENLKTHLEDGVWVIELQPPAVWIEDGVPAGFDMLEVLLKSPKAKMGPKGKWLAIPLKQNKAPTNTPASAAPIVDVVRAAMKAKKIPWGTIEKGADGKPLLGQLHKFSVLDKPLGTGRGTGPAQGWGPAGDTRQGPNLRQRAGGGPGGGGTPFLQNVSVRQRMHEGKVERSVMTFRIASESQRGTGMWRHPGLKPANILQDTFDFMAATWEKDVAPSILAQLDAAL